MTPDEANNEDEPSEPTSAERWTRDHRLALIGIVVALVVGAVGAFVSLHHGSGGSQASVDRSSKKAASTAAHRTHTQQQPLPEPSLNPTATCASIRQTATIDEPKPRRILVDSPGVIGGGPRTLEAHLMSNKRWTEWLHVRVGEEAELGIKLSDGAYGSVEDVSISTRVVEHSADCWRIAGVVRYATDSGRPTPLGPLLIQLQPGQRATKLTYVPHSTRLLDQHDKELAKLPDGVMGDRTTLPYSVPPAAVDVYFVNFRLKIS